jgi:hypothetical protein
MADEPPSDSVCTCSTRFLATTLTGHAPECPRANEPPFNSDTDLAELLEWVRSHEEEEGVAEFLRTMTMSGGPTIYELAESDPPKALMLAEALYEMCEELYDDGPDYRELFRRIQPKPERDEKFILP